MSENSPIVSTYKKGLWAVIIDSIISSYDFEEKIENIWRIACCCSMFADIVREKEYYEKAAFAWTKIAVRYMLSRAVAGRTPELDDEDVPLFWNKPVLLDVPNYRKLVAFGLHNEPDKWCSCDSERANLHQFYQDRGEVYCTEDLEEKEGKKGDALYYATGINEEGIKYYDKYGRGSLHGYAHVFKNEYGEFFAASMKYDRNIYYLEIPHCYSLKKKYKFEWSKLFFGEMNYHTRSLFYILSRWWDTWFRNKMIPAFLILYDGKKYYSQEVSIANCKKIGRVKQGQRKKRIRTHLLKE